MHSFRLALVVLFVFASAAAAQPASCTANLPFVTEIRAEAMTELIGDLVITCTGGTPSATNAFVPQYGVQVTLNTNITSPILTVPNPDSFINYNDALLIVDDPPAASQRACNLAIGFCTPLGTGNGVGVYSGSTAPFRPNIFQAQVVSDNTLIFPNVPIDAPAAGLVRTLRIANVRINASLLPSDGSVPVVATVSFVGGGTKPALNNGALTVGYPRQSVNFELRNPDGTAPFAPQYFNANNPATFKQLAILHFAEASQNAFRARTINTSPTSVTAQNVPGTQYQTETGFYYSSLSGANGSLSAAGLASWGSRVRVQITNVPSGVTLYLSTGPVQFNPLTGQYEPASGAQLVYYETSGYSPVNGTALVNINGVEAYPFNSLSGTSSNMAVWEITKPNPYAYEEFDFAVYVSWPGSPSGSPSIVANRAPAPPTYVNAILGATAQYGYPTPRFKDINTVATSLFTINSFPIISAVLAAGTAGTAYSGSIAVTRGATPYTWALETGSLPSGLTLNTTTGALTGTPVAGTYTFSVRVTDKNALVTRQSLTVVISPASGSAVSLSVVSLTPFSGTGAPTAAFKAIYATPNGWPDIGHGYILINNTLSPVNGCFVDYSRAAGAFALLSDDASTWSAPVVAGTTGTLTNSQCTLNTGTSSASGAGQQLTVNFAITFKTAFTGKKSIFLEAYDNRGGLADWLSVGVWWPTATTGVLTKWYRLFDNNSKTHHYTTDLNEYNTLRVQNFIAEGVAGQLYTAPVTVSGVAAQAWYRIYLAPGFSHFWTADRNEYMTLIQAYGYYLGEGVDGFTLPSKVGTAIPMYRLLFNWATPAIHHWTADSNEYGVLSGGADWTGEGVASYVVPAPAGAASPLPALSVLHAATRQTGAVAAGSEVSVIGAGEQVTIDGEPVEVIARQGGDARIMIPPSARLKSFIELGSGGHTVRLPVAPASLGVFATDSYGRGSAGVAQAGGIATLEITGARLLNEDDAQVWIGRVPAAVVGVERLPSRTLLRVVTPRDLHGVVAVRVRIGEHFSQSGVTLDIQ